jgi:DNA polymerase-3 subunit chi
MLSGVTEIGFYHLTRTTTEAAAPKLLGRVLETGGRALILVGGPERLAALDTALWTCGDPDWLPHGGATAAHAPHQPILLSLEDAPPANGARFLFLVDGADSARLTDFDRVFDLFDGGDEMAVAAARRRWAAAKAAGHVLTYWQQGARGWEKKASTQT